MDKSNFNEVIKVELQLPWDKELRGGEKVVAGICHLLFKEIKPERNAVEGRYRL